MLPGNFSFTFMTTSIGASIGMLSLTLFGVPLKQVLFATAVGFPLSLYLNYRNGQTYDK